MIITATVMVKMGDTITNGLSMLQLLLFEEDVPARARAAIELAQRAPAHERRAYLEAAARSLYREAKLDCEDARELVGLGASVSVPRSVIAVSDTVNGVVTAAAATTVPSSASARASRL